MLSIIVAAAISQTVQSDPVRPLAFMEGKWQCEKWGGTFHEIWLAPSAGTIQGVGKHVKDSKTGFMEFMSIENGADGVTMFILIGAPSQNQVKAAFKMTSCMGKKAVFEFPENDFPAKITYERVSDTSLKCTLEGTQNGKPMKDLFDFKRSKD